MAATLHTAGAKRVSAPRLVSVKTPKNTKAVRAPRKAPEVIDPKDLGVVDQVKWCVKPGKRIAMFLGALLGGVAPLISFIVTHHEIIGADGSRNFWQPAALLVLGGLLFSASTVYAWGKLAFSGSGLKALGLVLLLEGGLVISRTTAIGWIALAFLVAINAVATGANLALYRKPEFKF